MDSGFGKASDFKLWVKGEQQEQTAAAISRSSSRCSTVGVVVVAIVLGCGVQYVVLAVVAYFVLLTSSGFCIMPVCFRM